jgi:hypothetical protein
VISNCILIQNRIYIKNARMLNYRHVYIILVRKPLRKKSVGRLKMMEMVL